MLGIPRTNVKQWHFQPRAKQTDKKKKNGEMDECKAASGFSGSSVSDSCAISPLRKSSALPLSPSQDLCENGLTTET